MSYEEMSDPTVLIYTGGGWITICNSGSGYSFSTLPIWHTAECKGQDLSFSVVGNTGLMYGGTYALKPGQKVVLQCDGSNLAYMYVDTVKPASDGTSIAITCVDDVVLLASKGQTIYKDFYDSPNETNYSTASFDEDDSILYFTVSSGRYIGAPQLVEVLSSDTDRINEDQGMTWNQDFNFDLDDGSTNNYLKTDYNNTDYDYITKICFRAWTERSYGTELVGFHFEVYISDQSESDLTYVGSTATQYTSVDEMDYSLTLSTPYKVTDGSFRIIIRPIGGDDSGAEYYTYVAHIPMINTESYSPSSFQIIKGSSQTAVSGIAPKGQIWGYSYRTASDGYQSDGIYYISSLDEVASSDMVSTNFPLTNTSCIRYVSGSASTSTKDVISDLMGAIGVEANIYSGLPSSTIYKYRMAGGDALSAVQALLDLGDSTGVRRGAMRASGHGTVSMGLRYNITDSQHATIAYPEDNISGADQIVSCTPNLSMTRRCPVAVAKGTSSTSGADGSTSSSSTMVAILDFDMIDSCGQYLCTSVSDTDISDEYSAGKSAYSTVADARGADWSGTFVISGIHPEYISTDGSFYGSGIPILIYMSPIGMSGYKARVRESTISWEDCTTSLEVNNYSVLYNNNISSASDMSIIASDYSVMGAGADAFSTQYLLMVGSGVAYSNVAYVKILLASGAYASVAATIIRTDLGGYTVSGTFAPGSVWDNLDTHSVTTVYLLNSSKSTVWSSTVAEVKRPDKNRAQTLIVNVAMKT